ncbi:23S rRNA-intervening sequence protein [Methanophagales archaeon]|jgi:hypothetical protein|nr:23S rRNA-intervening sequence protein [Methanophagales archaeon]
MEQITGFEDLKVWQKSYEFVIGVYQVTQDFNSLKKPKT